MTVFPGEFDGGLIGLGAAVAEKNLVGKGVFHEQPGKTGLRFRVIEIGHMHERFRLPLNGGNDAGMGMAETAHGYAGGHVQIFPAVAIPDPCARAPGEGKRKPFIRVHDKFFVKIL